MSTLEDVEPARRSRRYLVIGGVSVLVLAVVYLMFASFSPGIVGLNTSTKGSFPSSLLWATPDPDLGSTLTATDPSNGITFKYTNLAGRDADYLNHTDNGSKGGTHLHYVDSSVPSSNYLTISVNAIDQYDWAAVALNNGHCYAIRVAEDPSNLENSSTFYARLQDGVPCKGTLATLATVRDVNVPN